MRTRRACGFGLIEVLVALLVLALGIIGGSAMQLTALRTRHQSTLLSNAVQMGAAMADKMRANAEQMQQDDAANPYLGLDYDAVNTPHPVAPGVLCFSTATKCSSAQMASFDIYELQQQLSTALPGGRVVICRDANAWDAGNKSLDWNCSGAARAPLVIKLGWRAKNPDGSAAENEARQYPPMVALTLTGASK